MDSERAPANPRSEITSPVLGIGEGRSRPIQSDPPGPSYPNAPRATTNVSRPASGNAQSATSSENLLLAETVSLHRQSNNNDPTQPLLPPQPVLLPESTRKRENRITNDGHFSGPGPLTHRPADVDWIVPIDEKESRRRTVGERLQPTIDVAIIEKIKCAANAKWTGYGLNFAIGLQVLLGSLTTGLSALSVSGGASTAKATTALGAIATLVASYLARARGSGEPDVSIARTNDLEQFIRECLTFQMDHGYKIGDEFDSELIGFRHRFEDILGNSNKGR